MTRAQRQRIEEIRVRQRPHLFNDAALYVIAALESKKP